MVALQLERSEILERLEWLPSGDARHEEALRGLWVVNGAIQEGYDYELLNMCAAKHLERGTMPRSYSSESLLR